MDNFISFAYAMTFVGMVFVTVLLVQFAKRFFTEVKTKWVVLAVAFLLCVIGAIVQGDWSSSKMVLETVVTWFINVAIVWFAAMSSFDVITNKDK